MDHIFVIVFCRHEQDGRGKISFANLFRKIEATHPRKHYVKQNYIIFGRKEKLYCALCPRLKVHPVVLQLQGIFQHWPKLVIVFNQQYGGHFFCHDLTMC